ncbi:MAG: hypothetical protein ABW061_08105, partial [Polyangiaceae bacterium]
MSVANWLTLTAVSGLLGACGGTTVLATGVGGGGGAAGNAGMAGDATGLGDAGSNTVGGDGPGTSTGFAGSGVTSGSAGTDGAPPPLPLDEVDGQKQSDKLDVLFVVDNSVSMAGKQQVLAQSVRAFVSRLANPRCVDAKGQAVAKQPASGSEDCSSGTREFTPVTDMHLGAITSSLGGHGGAVCATDQS